MAGLALALFALRIVVPVGFMLSVGPSGAAVSLCPDFAPLPTGAHAHHHHAVGGSSAGDPAGAPSVAEDHGICPFGAAGHLAWHPASGTDPLFLQDSGILPRTEATDRFVARSRLFHPHSPRAPPRNLG